MRVDQIWYGAPAGVCGRPSSLAKDLRQTDAPITAGKRLPDARQAEPNRPFRDRIDRFNSSNMMSLGMVKHSCLARIRKEAGSKGRFEAKEGRRHHRSGWCESGQNGRVGSGGFGLLVQLHTSRVGPAMTIFHGALREGTNRVHF